MVRPHPPGAGSRDGPPAQRRWCQAIPQGRRTDTMPMQTPMDLFVHELGDIYDEENRLLQILPALADEASNPQVKNAFLQHLRETQQQVQNLEQCFQALGQQPQRETCAAIQGLKQEHDTFVKENPSPQVLDMFDLGAGLKTEYYEMASYQGLIEKAQLLGQQS